MLAAVTMLTGCAAETAQPAVTSAEPALTAADTSVAYDASDTAESTLPGGYIPRSEQLDCLYYEDKEFHFYDDKSSAYDIGGDAVCGIAPHHLTAGQYIAGLYKTAALRGDIETVVLIAPMHYETGNTLTTSKKGWNTVFGTVRNDTEITELFCDRLGAVTDDHMTEYDHSASSHIPFISYYLPDVRVSCLLVSPKETADLPERLTEVLCEAAEMKNCFFAFSIDFSHYLDPDEAELHDTETEKAVLNGDLPTILRFTNSNVDTPYCLSTFVQLSERLGGSVIKADHGNTFTIGILPYSRTTFPEGVTSYFVFLTSV